MWLMFGYKKIYNDIYKHDIIYVHDKYTYMYIYMYIICGFSTFCSSDV